MSLLFYSSVSEKLYLEKGKEDTNIRREII